MHLKPSVLFLFLATLSSFCDRILSEEIRGTSKPNPCPGEGWIPYQSEKCYKILESFSNWTAAQNLCQASAVDSDLEVPSFPTIRSKPEQDFLSHYIFNVSRESESFWLGASRNGNLSSFSWGDGSPLTFQNWADSFPTSDGGRPCVEMVSQFSRVDTDGEWKDTICSKRNLVVCEKLQRWSILDLQKAVFELRLNTVPVGFMYTQLPFMAGPESLWPSMGWTDVSERYAGRFFRVVGGNAANFEVAQADAFQGHEHYQGAPRVMSSASGGMSTVTYVRDLSYSGRTTGVASNNQNGYPRTASETRPMNYALRIWQRVA